MKRIFLLLLLSCTLYAAIAQPTVAAPAPTCPAVDVLSMFSNTYTDVAVDTWRTPWSAGDLTDLQIAGNDTKLYQNLNFVGIETVGPNLIDASAMTHFHVDYWTADMTELRIKLVDWGANGSYDAGGADDSEHEITITSPTLGQWVSLAIPLTDFTNLAATNNIAQLIFAGQPVGNGTLYIDNVYYSNNCVVPPAPMVAAPTPTCPTTDVISMFSNAYTDVAVDTWITGWSSGNLTDLQIAGDDTKLYENLSFVGIETLGPNLIDASGMTHFHLDYWTADMTELRIKLVDFGANELYGDGAGNAGGDDTEHEITIASPAQGAWTSLVIPLANFAGLASMTDLAQYIIAGQPAGSGTLYIDNMYFSNGCGPVEMSCVTFSVDMNGYAGAFTTPHVSGDFNAWSGTANPMTDIDNDGVWTTTIDVPNGANEYRFTLDNLAAEESMPTGGACTVVNGAQTNRTITVSGDTDVCYTWDSCDACLCPVLVWADEFDGAALDLAKWTPQIGDGCSIGLCGWGNNELEYYRAENAEVSGGTLKIIAKQETFGGRNYTSARLRSINQGDWTYGRFEASIKLPIGQGIWPAFWMLPTDNVYGGWPQSGEIDIMEMVGHEPDVVHGTIHYGQPWPNNASTGQSYQLVCDVFNDDFHEFAVEWEPNEIRWYVDDYLFSTRTPADVAPENWPFNEKFHFLLNVAVGGNWPGAPDATTVFPQQMEVDYVRVYKGDFSSIGGNRTVDNQANSETYTVSNSPAGSSYTWIVPAGATITSGQGTNTITVDWGGTTSTGDVSVVENGVCGTNTIDMKVKVDVERFNILDCVLENFDDAALINYSNSIGTYEDNIANPAPGASNPSALVGRYTRDAGDQYDNLNYTTAVITDASEFVSGAKKFYLDLYTTAPIGTTIILQLENSASAIPTNYPTGRHSRYQITTTVQNAWERLEFAYVDRPDGSTPDNSVDRIVILFNPNSFTNDVYYYDNFEKYCTGTASDCGICIAPKVFLQGPFNGSDMNATLDGANLVPFNEPYTAMGHTPLNTGTSTGNVAFTGTDEIVDWVLVELRDASTNTTVVASTTALLQKDGDVVGSDGTSTAVCFPGVAAGNYHVVIKHRNHLGVMTQMPISIN